jgi:predicted ATPase
MRSDLPSGTVTFLFTDVEGSTKLLHSLGAEGYAEALTDHRRLIREACTEEGGIEVDTQGDAFFFAFPTAPGALAAASALTDALASSQVQVRVGLHTGTPLLTEEGYVGEDVHRAARIAAAGHGGQMLVSASTAPLVELELRDLGEHRFKDLSAPERVYQAGEGDFPPLKTLHQTNLPVPQTPFLGREKELGEVLVLFARDDVRLLTLTGPGGTGKTRLAAQAAGTLAERYPQGVFWVPLAALRDPELVLESAGQAVGAKNGLASHIADKRMLLLFDNFEQVVEAAPGLSTLLGECPQLELLVTSREPLHLAGEQEYPVPPFAAEDGVGFFMARAQAVRPDFEIDEAVPEICRRLDELPLALELAASRVTALSTAQILSRLEQRLPLLTGGTRDAPERQRTLKATIEWSYELLSPEEQKLFARLSVFAGGCTLEAAEEVADADLDTLQSLVEKSLLRFTNERYSMLETIREYASGTLERTGEIDAICARHAKELLHRTKGVDRELQSPAAAMTLQELERESDNIRAVLTWMDQVDQAGSQLDLIGQIWRSWVIRGTLLEGRRWVERALAGSGGEHSLRRAICLRVAAVLTRSLGELDAARRHAEESLALSRELGDERIAQGLSVLASISADQGDYLEAQRLFEEAADFSRGGDKQTRAFLTGSLADLAMRQGDYERALALAEESVALFRELMRDDGVSWALFTVALSQFQTDREDDAVHAARESLSLAYALVEVETIVWILFLLGAIATRRRQHRSAAMIFGAAEALRARSELAVSGAEAQLYGATVEELHRTLGTRLYDSAFAEGHAMSLEEAVEYALASLD